MNFTPSLGISWSTCVNTRLFIRRLNNEVADTAIMLWLAVYRKLIQADRWVRQGAWEKEGSFPLSRSVQNQKVGILGLGRIGETIAKRVKAFEAEIHYHSRSQKNNDYIFYLILLSIIFFVVFF